MKLTSKGRYAVTAILDLAFHARSGPVPLPNIAGRQGLSLSYLEQLFTRLRKAGLVDSTRGPGGGYTLARAAPEISVAEVIAAVDERVDNTTCSGAGNCHEGEQCLTHELWDDLGSQISGFLGGISLQDLVNEEEIRSVAARQDAAAGQAITVAPPVE
ncbi:MAG: Rrf2 family transcriptional regulator [Gammaproteobacteria bacterium]|nr:Rrf2 family transcriptional regulator [Gammaproteobacteria bacterium]MDH5514805.1 Rrf2 family transcriptional regulator [Gammaproteobacteria bacterium]